MWPSIVLVFAVNLLIVSLNGVTGRLKCSTGEFHELSSTETTGCKPCSTCQGKAMAECRKHTDTVCCRKQCASDSYLDERTCVCRLCTRTCPPNHRRHTYCGERNDALCVPVGVVTASTRVVLVVPSSTSRVDETTARKTDQTPSTVRHRETTPVINPDIDASPTAGLPQTTVGTSQTSQPHQTYPKHVTRSVFTSRAASPPRGDTSVKSTAGVTSTDLTRPLWIITFVLGSIVVVTIASLLLYCKLTMTCWLKRKPKRGVGVSNDHQWRMQPPLNNSYADSPSLDVGSPDRSKDPSLEARSGSGVTGSTSIGSFGTSSTTDGEEIAFRDAEWGCEPVTTVWGSKAPPAAGRAPERRGDNVSFYPRDARPSMSMNNVFPTMSPSPSKVWIDQNGRSKVYHGRCVNGGAHCCHHHHAGCEHQQVCHCATCMDADSFLSSSFSIGSLGSGCTV